MRLRGFLIYLSALVSLAGLSACDETLDPFLESDRNFTLFGTLDLAKDTQYVRVIPIRETLEIDDELELDVEFSSEDLHTGERVEWRDSLVTFADASTGHVFWAPIRLRPGHTYRIEVRSPNHTAVTTAETTVPRVPTARVAEEQLVRVGPGLATATQAVIWSGVDRTPFRVDQYYRFMISPRGVFSDVVLPYEPRGEAADPQMWVVELDLREDKRTLDTLISTARVPLAGLGMQVTTLDPAFSPPEGVFDADVLSQPGTMSNVENGFGFVGSVGRFSVEWLLRRQSVKDLGYVTLEETYATEPEPPVVRILPFEWSAMP